MLLTSLLLVLEVLCSVLLIGVILIQKSKGGGLSGSAFGGAGETMLGARAGNVLTKITITLSIVFMVNTLVLAFIYADSGDDSLMGSAVTVPVGVTPVEPVDAGGEGDAAADPGAIELPLAGEDVPMLPEPDALPAGAPEEMPPAEPPPAETPAP